MTAYFCLTLSLFAQTAEAPLRFRTAPEGGCTVVASLSKENLAALPAGRLSQQQGEALLTVGLVPAEAKAPLAAMLGSYQRQEQELIFTPRFPFDAGQTYRAVLKQAGKTVTLDYRVPHAIAATPPRVVKIYPSADVLPANHLKFYLYFDRPMRGGKELFKQIVLVDDQGKEIADPWLLDELWDERENCLILYIHPGRIKWGVLLRELLGPVLVADRNYRLILRSTLTDVDGNALGKDVVKKFRTVAEDRARVDLSAWKLSAPPALSRNPLTVAFPKSLDHRALQKFMSLTDEQGMRIAGTSTAGKDEKSWNFTPVHPWQAQGYRLEVNGELEDVAGNTPLRPFDLDLRAPKQAPQRLRLEFQPRKTGSSISENK